MIPPAFRSRIRAALANPNLQAALDANAQRRLNAREQALASLPQPWEIMRQRAHAVRATVIAHLDELLEQFVARVEANGVIVHRAADASQAVDIVAQIARQNQARLIAKSKSMVSEEIGLNHTLEAQGFKVVETDLGEFIVQLRGERPAHIVTPAVHLRRQDVGQTFFEKLGLPFTDEISTLTTAARRVLRQVFLEADIGISGVNFGVAESGTLCIVTNEGNGRMVTTLPPVHIALMGIERLVPTLDDLALMLYLLPRSATGQKLTVYTSLIHGPTSPEATIGPHQRHLILVDNGRSALRHTPLAESLYCIRCGACLNACPVFRELGGHAYVNTKGESSVYPGPIGSIVSPGLFGQAEFGHLARASSLCGACREACPVDIDLPKLLLRVRAGMNAPAASQPSAQGQSTTPNVPTALALGLRLYTWIAISSRRFIPAQRLFGLLAHLLSPFSSWIRLPAFTGWGYSRDFPRPASRPFRLRFQSLDATASAVAPATSPPEPRSPSGDTTLPQSPQAALWQRFEDELTALGGTLTYCKESELASRLLSLLHELDITSLMVEEDAFLPVGLLDELGRQGLSLSSQPDPELKAGLTSAVAAIAESGTLLLCSAAGRPLLASLLPQIHLAVIHAGQIYESLPQVLGLPVIREAPAAVLISGPSRTADIEMTLTIGVHGPGTLHVFCIEE